MPPVGPIVDVLQYSQKDLDAAVRTRHGDGVHVMLGWGLAKSWVDGSRRRVWPALHRACPHLPAGPTLSHL